jgi:hypothetical protein
MLGGAAGRLPEPRCRRDHPQRGPGWRLIDAGTVNLPAERSLVVSPRPGTWSTVLKPTGQWRGQRYPRTTPTWNPDYGRQNHGTADEPIERPGPVDPYPRGRLEPPPVRRRPGRRLRVSQLRDPTAPGRPRPVSPLWSAPATGVPQRRLRRRPCPDPGHSHVGTPDGTHPVRSLESQRY